MEAEKIKRNSDLEEASDSYQRHMETTIYGLDYRDVILVQSNFSYGKVFDDLDQFLEHLMSINF